MTLKRRLTFAFAWFCVLCLVSVLLIGALRIVFHTDISWRPIALITVFTIVMEGIAVPALRKARRDWKMTAYERFKSR
jgi:2-hydroxychromene-2-carboxylate isomerase